VRSNGGDTSSRAWPRSETARARPARQIDAQLDRTPDASPLTSKWWFWTAVGVVVLAGVATTVLLATTEKDPQVGTFGPGPIRVASF